MANYDKLKVELVFFKKKNDQKEDVYKLGNFMFVHGDDSKECFVMPTPTNLMISQEKDKVDKSSWFEIVKIHFFDGDNFGIPTDGSPVQYFGDI